MSLVNFGEIEVGTCEICGKENVSLHREYYRYPNIKCECHSPCHFDIVRYCENCKPVPPKETRLSISSDFLKRINDILESNW